MRRIFKVVVIFVGLFMLSLYALNRYNDEIEDSISDFASLYLSETTRQQVQTLKAIFETKAIEIEMLAKLLMSSKSEPAGIRERLQSFFNVRLDKQFNAFFFADLNGDTTHYKNVADMEYFIRARDGATFVSDTIVSEIEGRNITAFSTPCIEDEKIIGVLVGLVDTFEFGKTIVPAFDGRGSVNIIDRDGNNVFSAVDPNNPKYQFAGGNFFKIFSSDSVTFLDNSSYKETVDNLTKQIEGMARYSIGEKSRLMSYAPVGINGWTITSVVTEDVLDEVIAPLRNKAQVLIFFVASLFALFAAYSILSQAYNARKIYKMAYFDKFTGAPNGDKFKLDAERILKKNPKTKFFVVKFDILKFRIINELFGFDIGDKVILAVNDVLRSDPNLLGTYARSSVDEFVLLKPMLNDGYMEEHALWFHRAFREKTNFLKNLNVDFRAGRYLIGKNDEDIEQIIEKVNIAHRISKTKIIAQNVTDYDDVLRDNDIKNARLQNKMDEALKNREFKMLIQPKYRLSDGKLAGGEALVRWMNGEGGMMLPAEFIPLFEKNGEIVKLDCYMLSEACSVIKKWIDAGLDVVTISVNFSRLHLLNNNFVEELSDMVESYGVPKHYIEIELTESILFDNEKILISVLEQLHSKGFTLSMDDFGTGYSSLGLLKNLPVDALKVDKSFFDHEKDVVRANLVIESVFGMARRMSIKTIAEGVETQEHVDLLRGIGCDMVQGYYYSKPVPVSEFEKLLTK